MAISQVNMDENNKKLNTIHEKDLQNVLIKIGLFEDLQKGILRCKFCGEKIELQNIYSILPESGSFNLVCDKPECISKLIQYLNEKKLNEESL